MNRFELTKSDNKGWRKFLKEVKKREAEERNAKTSPERRRSFARQFGYSRNSDRIRNGLEV